MSREKYDVICAKIARHEMDIEALKIERDTIIRAEIERRWSVKPGVVVVTHSAEYIVHSVRLYSNWPERPPHLVALKLGKHGLPGKRLLDLWSADWRLPS